MNFGEKLKELRQKSGFSGELLAEKLKPYLPEMKVSKGHVSNWEKRSDPPSQKVIYAYCKVFDITEGHLRGLNTAQKITSVPISQNEGLSVSIESNASAVDVEVVGVPLVGVKAQAGQYLTGYADPDYMETLPKEYFPAHIVRGGNFRVFEVSGDSMNDGTVRSFLPEDKVLTRELYQKYWIDTIKSKKDKPFVIVHQNTVYFKEIIAHDVKNGIITCHSWNPSPQYKDFTLDLREVLQIWYYVSYQRK